MRDSDQELLERYDMLFGASRVAVLDVSAKVIDRATALRARYGFKSPDAIHLATAIESGATEFWTGDAPRFLGYELCQASRRVLLGEVDDPAWSARARRVLETSRAEYAFLQDAPAPILESTDRIEWWTFAGGGANLLLARMLEHELGSRVTSNNLSIRFKEKAGESVVALRQALDVLRVRGAPTPEDCARFAFGEERKRFSKFDPCLPGDLLGQLVVEANLDSDGAKAALRQAGQAGDE